MNLMVERRTVMFGGFGGQGIVLSSIVLGLAAVYDGMYVCQRASYGAEARGGRCKSEVIISKSEISYPLIDSLKFLVVMSQQAYDSYLEVLGPCGHLFFDPDMVDIRFGREDVNFIEVPAAKTADMLGNRIVANMIMLGALQESSRIVSKKALRRSIIDSVAARFRDIDLKAMEEGAKMVMNFRENTVAS
jgi:2-oxoglutarate ferredoxin oxidoreductase subunit gamma